MHTHCPNAPVLRIPTMVQRQQSLFFSNCIRESGGFKMQGPVCHCFDVISYHTIPTNLIPIDFYLFPFLVPCDMFYLFSNCLIKQMNLI
jgi:hypothetical protein